MSKQSDNRSNSRRVTHATDGTGKTCTGCKRYLTLDSFHKFRRMKDGLQRYCKDCNYASNCTALPVGDNKIVYAEQPLKRAYYETVIIHGQPMQRYVTK